MKIAEFGTLQMVHTDKAHFGQRNIQPAGQSGQSKSFQSYLLDALSTVNNQQLDVNTVEEKLITNPTMAHMLMSEKMISMIIVGFDWSISGSIGTT